MKKWMPMLLALLLTVMMCGCAEEKVTESNTKEEVMESSPEEEVTENNSKEEVMESSPEKEVMESYPEDVYVQMAIDAIGEDLMTRAKEAGYSLSITLEQYEFNPPYEEYELKEDEIADPLVICLEVRSPIGSTLYGNNTVDCDLMYELQCALIDSGIFELSGDEIATLKEQYYAPDHWNSSTLVANGHVELHINESPGGYEALIMLRHWQVADTTIHRLVRQSVYTWEEGSGKYTRWFAGES